MLILRWLSWMKSLFAMLRTDPARRPSIDALLDEQKRPKQIDAAASSSAAAGTAKRRKQPQSYSSTAGASAAGAPASGRVPPVAEVAPRA